MRTTSIKLGSLALLLSSSIAFSQPPGITMEMINRTLPLEGAPLAEPGPYAVMTEGAYDTAGQILFRPTELSAFPAQDKLPLMIWGNGGCAIDGTRYGDFLSTIASYGFLVMTTKGIEGEDRRQANASDMLAAIDWAEAENQRAGSPLMGKIDTSQIAVMGQSCGGFLSVSLGTDSRVGTIGVFNSGVRPPNPDAAAVANTAFPSTGRGCASVLWPAGQDRQLSGRCKPVSRERAWQRAGGVPALSARGVGARCSASEEGRGFGSDRVSYQDHPSVERHK